MYSLYLKSWRQWLWCRTEPQDSSQEGEAALGSEEHQEELCLEAEGREGFQGGGREYQNCSQARSPGNEMPPSEVIGDLGKGGFLAREGEGSARRMASLETRLEKGKHSPGSILSAEGDSVSGPQLATVGARAPCSQPTGQGWLREVPQVHSPTGYLPGWKAISTEGAHTHQWSPQT